MNNFLHNHPGYEEDLDINPEHAIVDRKDWEITVDFLKRHPKIATILILKGTIKEESFNYVPYTEPEELRKQAIQMLRERGILKERHTKWWVTFADGSQQDLIQLMIDFKLIKK